MQDTKSSIENDFTRIETDVAHVISHAFTRVERHQLPEAYWVKTKSGDDFGCDDYGLLFNHIFGHRPDLSELIAKATTLAQLHGETGLSNQQLATIIEGVAVVFEDQKEMHQVALSGYWRAKPPI